MVLYLLQFNMFTYTAVVAFNTQIGQMFFFSFANAFFANDIWFTDILSVVSWQSGTQKCWHIERCNIRGIQAMYMFCIQWKKELSREIFKNTSFVWIFKFISIVVAFEGWIWKDTSLKVHTLHTFKLALAVWPSWSKTIGQCAFSCSWASVLSVSSWSVLDWKWKVPAVGRQWDSVYRTLYSWVAPPHSQLNDPTDLHLYFPPPHSQLNGPPARANWASGRSTRGRFSIRRSFWFQKDIIDLLKGPDAYS